MEQVSLDNIDYDNRTFCISYPLFDDRLTASIKQFGITSPLILLGPPPFRVVNGFRRLEAALQLGFSDVPGLVLAADDRAALLLALNDKVFGPINIVEKAMAAKAMAAGGLRSDEFEYIMKAMGLQHHKKVMSALLGLADSEEPFKAFAARHNPAMQQVALLLALGPEIRTRLLVLLSSMRLTSSLLREIIDLARLVTIKQGGLPFDDLEGLTDGVALKERLKTRAYPLLTKMQEKLKSLKNGMHLPSHITITVDSYFERSDIDIGITAGDRAKVLESLGKLQELTENGHMGSLFELIDSKPHRD